ncbi:MAG: hypothetical protein JWQ25_859 [Daejeonella sp.]|nr:hypothetical protein [Daejeonella sp.]
MLKPDIAVIINSYNRLFLLKDCIRALAKWLPDSPINNKVVLIIYDAGSTDGSTEWILEQSLTLPLTIEVLVPKKGDDTSFAAGINAGSAYAINKFPHLKWLLFYETDNQIIHSKPLLQAISQLKSQSNLAACGFTVVKRDGSPAGVGQPFPGLLNFLLGKQLIHKLQLEAIPYSWKQCDDFEFSLVDVVYTSPLLVKVDAWIASGGLDAAVFPFSDCDVDWARRLYDLGWKMGVIKTDQVIHDNADSLSSWSKARSIHNHRGRLKYFKRHRSISVFLVWPAALLLRHLFELLSVRFLIKDPLYRNHLYKQFFYLIKSCPRGYEQ